MLAPTRHLVAALNARARAHRLDHSPAASEVSLADGNRASVGDVIITRTNDRQLRLTELVIGLATQVEVHPTSLPPRPR